MRWCLFLFSLSLVSNTLADTPHETTKFIVDETLPFGVSAAFAGTTAGTSMAITWSTMTATTYNHVVFGTTSRTYPNYTNTGPPTSYYQSYQHHALLEGLLPNTKYYYRVGSAVGGQGQSDEFTFRTAKSSGDWTPFSMAVFGDMGINESEDTVTRLKALKNADFYYHVGDIGYADDHNSIDPLNNKAFEETWNIWQDDMEEVTANYGYMVCPGNHEASCKVAGDINCPEGLNNFTAYNSRFRMPSPESGGVKNMWYSFDYGMVHFVSINTETDIGVFPPEGPTTPWRSGNFGDQVSWLQADLEAADRRRDLQPWVVVIGHRPLYSSVSNEIPKGAMKRLRTAIEDLLYDNNVDLYISGHVHAYERLYPIYQSVVDPAVYNNPRAVTPIVIGNAGNLEGVASLTSEVPDFIAFRDRAYGYGVLNFEDENNLSLQSIKAEDNSVVDQLKLFRKHF